MAMTDELGGNEPMRGMELMARTSIYSLRPPSISSNATFLQSNDGQDRIWLLPALRVSYPLFFRNYSFFIQRLDCKFRLDSKIRAWRRCTTVTSSD